MEIIAFILLIIVGTNLAINITWDTILRISTAYKRDRATVKTNHRGGIN